MNKRLCIALATTFALGSTGLGLYPKEKVLYAEIVPTTHSLPMVKEDYETNKSKVQKLLDKAEIYKLEKEASKRIERDLEIQKQKRLQDYYDKLCYYNPDDISQKSNISVKKALELLKNTTYNTLEDAQAFVDAEKLSPSVNTIFLISLCNFESYYGKSQLSQNNNNVTSWRLDNGWRYFNSKTECITMTAQMLSREYLNENGNFYTGKSIYQIGQVYCPEGTNKWIDSINNLANKLK